MQSIRARPSPRSFLRFPIGRLLAAVLLFAVGCRPEQPAPDLGVTWTVSPDPPRTGPTTVQVALVDSAGTPVQSADVDIEATMTHPGMRPEMADAHEVEPGIYEAELNLTMGGDWMLILQAELPDGRSMRRQKELAGVSSESGREGRE